MNWTKYANQQAEIPFEVFEIDDISELIMENCSNGYSIRQLKRKDADRERKGYIQELLV